MKAFSVIRSNILLLCSISFFTVTIEGNSECKSIDDSSVEASRSQTYGSDIASRLWSPDLSNQANIKRFRAIRTGLLQNINVTIHELYDAVEASDTKEVDFQLRQINEKWKDIQDLHRAIIHHLPDEDINGLQEETKLFVDNRDVFRRLNEQAEEFLARILNSTSAGSVSPEIKPSLIKTVQPLPSSKFETNARNGEAQTVIPILTPSSFTVRPAPVTTTRYTTTTRTPIVKLSTTTPKPTTRTPVLIQTTSTTAPLSELDRYKNKREKLIEQMRNIIRTIEPAVESQNSKTREEVRNLLGLLDDKVWPQVIKLSAKIYADEEPSRRWRESLYQQDLKNTLARIHYKTGLRKCISADETYYQGLCQRYGNPGIPCAENQQLYDGKDNNGFCHCKYQDPTQPHNGLVYVDGQCYVQNVQGPCAIGQWIVVNDDGDPVCASVPVGCGPPAKDGRKVFWTPDLKKPGMCAHLGSRQPCGTLFRRGFQLFCGNHPNATIEQSPVRSLPPLAQQQCPLGFFVDQYNRCIRGIQF